MEFGISTFGEIIPDHSAGKAVNAHTRIQNILKLATAADEWGLDILALGEHHRNDFVISAPEMVLSAIAASTRSIKLSSAVTVLSSADPVRIFQHFATLDLISSGRAEIMAGRGSFIESFPLFGYDLKHYDELFAEKLELLLEINRKEHVSWKGKHRAAIENIGVYPRPFNEHIPVWIAVGGTPSSVVRAATLNLPLTIAILGGSPAAFTRLTDLYKNTLKKENPGSAYQLCINEHLYIADTAQKARDEYWPVYGPMMNKIGKERGWQPMHRQHFDMLCEPDGPLMVGSPADIVEKIVYQYSLFQNTRFLAQIIFGNIPFEKIYDSVALLANEVVPKVKSRIQKTNAG